MVQEKGITHKWEMTGLGRAGGVSVQEQTKSHTAWQTNVWELSPVCHLQVFWGMCLHHCKRAGTENLPFSLPSPTAFQQGHDVTGDKILYCKNDLKHGRPFASLDHPSFW